jgi:putative transposase
MGSVGDCYDNALAESFFATLECDLIVRQRFRNHVAAKRAIFEFIEGWYNPGRRHSALGQQAPKAYEAGCGLPHKPNRYLPTETG